MKYHLNLPAIFVIILTLSTAVAAQPTTAFTYQGKLTDSGTPQPTYQMQFRLFDALAGGTQIGTTIEDAAVSVSSEGFTVRLDFGASVFEGADRYLEIGVRRNSGESYTVLTPRQQITSSPYSIRTLSATQADLALDSQKLGGIDASEYVTNGNVGGSFIRNSSTQQTTANFNIDGSGTVGGNLGVGTEMPESKVTAQTAFNEYGFTHTDGKLRLSTFLGGSGNGGYFGTRSNHPLHFYTNDSAARMTITPGGDVGIGTTVPQSPLNVFRSTPGYGFTHSHGAVTVGSFVSSGAGWFGTRSNHPLNFFTNDGGASMQIIQTGEVGIGVAPEAGWKLDVGAPSRIRTPNGNINLSTPNGGLGITLLNDNRADLRFDQFGLQLVAGLGTGIPANTSGIQISPTGVVGIGGIPILPGSLNAKLHVNGNGGNFTHGISVFNNSSGRGTAMYASNPDGGGYAVYADGNLSTTGNLRQTWVKFGNVKAMIHVDRNAAILRCWNGFLGLSEGNCGITITEPLGQVGVYRIDFGIGIGASMATRFASVTPQYASTCNVIPNSCKNAGANFVINGDYLEVFTFHANNAADTTQAAFMVIVY